MKRVLLITGIIFMAGCQNNENPNEVIQPDYNNFNIEELRYTFENARRASTKIDGDEINISLSEKGLNYRLVMAEYLVAPGSEQAGKTVYFMDIGNKMLGFDFVPFDERRSDWSGPADMDADDITYAIDQVDADTPSGLPADMTNAAIDRAMNTWENVICSMLPISRNPDYGIDLGVVAWIYGLGGGPFVVSDIMHAGWWDIDFPDDILGVTYTFGFVDEEDNFTDINHDGKLDCAFREIYYDPSWVWAIDDHIDVETIALHESGHGLSQGHFGTLFRTDRNGYFHFSPRALMNAGYTGIQQNLSGSDVAGHCANWAQWPEN